MSFAATNRSMKLTRTFTKASVAMLALVSLAACSDTPPATGSDTRRIALALDNSDGDALLLDPRTATMHVGFGMLIRAQITGADGQPIAGAQPNWRSTNESVVRLTPLPDSGFSDDGARVVAIAHGEGTALVIASFGGAADTATITVAPRQQDDSTGGVPAPVPARFELGLYVSTQVDTTLLALWKREPVPNATVRLVQLPLLPGDSVPGSAPQVTIQTLRATAVTDTAGFVVFSDIPMSRYRLEVQPPAGSAWVARNIEMGPPGVASVRLEARLIKN